ncbi:MAG: flavodoxin domain-containing protein [Treponema sp.]|nr:flavodoxin [Spirochaetia bacterium]MDD7460212.1 flavodoxin domain-containing protein [Spirochaetales bacterium]MDY5810763.1 flavodoxin domain-containing protein [Treponema sp.]MEE1181070.1 flavodoxin domain-containing protein [Treponema sp.]
MKTVILYSSFHKGNTKKIVDAVAEKHQIPAVNVAQQKEMNLSDYDCIGIASGVAFSKYYPQMLDFLKKNLPENKKVFFMHTAGLPRENHNAAAKEITDGKNCTCLGTFFCKGFDAYGALKLIGGINKKSPKESDIQNAQKFVDKILAKYV